MQHVPDAWRILSHACLKHSLLPAIAEWNHREALQRLENPQEPEEPAGSGQDTGFAMSHPTPAGSSMDTTEPASPTGLEPVDKRSKAAQMYTLYRRMRIDVAKRRKHKSGGHSSLGSAVAGLAAGRVMRLHEDWKQLLIEEYATLQGQDVPAPDNFSA